MYRYILQYSLNSGEDDSLQSAVRVEPAAGTEAANAVGFFVSLTQQNAGQQECFHFFLTNCLYWSNGSHSVQRFSLDAKSLSRAPAPDPVEIDNV
jgi:hypothetical protein